MSLEDAQRRGDRRPARRQDGPPNPNGYLAELRGQRVCDWQGAPIPERRWIADDWIPSHQVTLLMGDSGIGKTTIALQLATAVTLGERWLGQLTTRSPVLMLLCEDETDENQRRMQDVAALYGVQFEDLEGLEIIVPEDDDDEEQDTSLMTFDRYTEEGTTSTYYFRILKRAKALGARLVILDTLADFFSGNENVRRHVVQFMKLARRLAKAIDGAVVICGHPSRAGLHQGTGESGSTHWKAKARSFLYFEKAKDEDGETIASKRILTRAKSNYAEAGAQIRLTWQDGVYACEQESGGDFVDRLEEDGLDRALVNCLHRLLQDGFEPSHRVESRSAYAPKLMVGQPGMGGATVKQIAKAMDRVMRAGDVVLGETIGPPSRRKKIIVPKGHPLALKGAQGRIDVPPELPLRAPTDTPTDTTDTPP